MSNETQTKTELLRELRDYLNKDTLKDSNGAWPQWYVGIIDTMLKKEVNTNEDKTNELIDFFEQREGWDLDEFITDTVEELNVLKHKSMGDNTLSIDECGIEWDDDNICNLQDFVYAYTRNILKSVVNVIKSYEKE